VRVRVGIVLAVTGVTFLAFSCRERESAASAELPKIEVKAAVGTFDGTTVVAPIEGRIAQLLTSEGAAVHAGDRIATLTNPAVDRDLAHARAAVASVEARMHGRVAPVARPRRSGEVENAEAELAIAQRDLNAELDRGAAPQVAPDDPRLLQAEADRARADLTFAEYRQTQLVITAPVAGTIAKLRVTQGADVYARDPIAEVVDSSMARVEARIAPELLRFVRTGKAVDVRLMTIPPRRFREPITRVVQPAGEGGAAIMVNVPNPDRMLQPGTPAVITIQ
jgi:multidrug resistance efflux pump